MKLVRSLNDLGDVLEMGTEQANISGLIPAAVTVFLFAILFVSFLPFILLIHPFLVVLH